MEDVPREDGGNQGAFHMPKLAVIYQSLFHPATIILARSAKMFLMVFGRYPLKVDNRNRRPKYPYLPHYYGLSLYQKIADTVRHPRYHQIHKKHQSLSL